MKGTCFARRDGVSMVLVAFLLLLFFGFAAIAIDVARVLNQNRLLQNAVDAGALAGATLLTNSSVRADTVIEEARQLALANTVTDKEIAAGAKAGLPGEIQLGVWSENIGGGPARGTFTPSSGGTWNAVRVPASRTVELVFGRVLGVNSMSPTVASVAVLTGVSSIDGSGGGGVVPFGIENEQVAGKQFGDVIGDLSKESPGNWGKLDLNGETKNPNDWYDAFLNGYDGKVSIGDTPDSDPGFAHLKSAFDDRLARDPIVIVPIVDGFSNGKKPVKVLGFAAVELLTQGKSGANWNGQVRFMQYMAPTGRGGSGGGPTDPPFVKARALVE